MTSILIADDHPMIRTALEVLLRDTEFHIVGEANSGADTLEAIREHDPDIVLLDIRMPHGSGVDVFKQLRAAGDKRNIVVLTASLTDRALLDALNCKVNGIVLKNADPANLLDCLETVRAGGTWIDPELNERIKNVRAASDAGELLTPRELELIGLVRKGLRNRDIALALGVTEGTVKVYLHSIFDKTGVANRTELAMKADEMIGSEMGK